MKQEFEGFDFTNFWDDNYYARKEYISDAPTDELDTSCQLPIYG